MFRILHDNGQHYGPVSAEVLRQWIREGRIHAGTLVCADGSTDWKALGTLTEFQSFTVPPPSRGGDYRYYTTIRRTNPWAVWGFVCGLLSLTLCSCCCLPLDLFGIIFSVIALVQISNNPQTESGNALAILGLILSLLSFILGFAMTFFWLSTGGGEEFLRQIERELQLGIGFILR